EGFGSVAFGPGGRVVAGGWDPALIGAGGRRSAGVLWDGDLATRGVATTRFGPGPGAFPDADSPLQLLYPTKVGQPLPLWNVGTHAAEGEVPLPWPGRVGHTALSANARYAAASFTRRLVFGLSVPVTLLWEINRNPGAGTARRL